MYSIQGKLYKTESNNTFSIEFFTEQNSSIIELINTENIINPSNDLKLKVNNITQTDLNDLITKKLVKNNNLLFLISLLHP
jgi:hypothetical protein